MKSYRTIDEAISDRRKGMVLSDLIENLLHSPYVLEQIETPFDIIGGLQDEDYINFSTPAWKSLPIEPQIRYGTKYQEWFAHQIGSPIEKTIPLNSDADMDFRLIPPIRHRIKRPILKVNAFWMGKYPVTNTQWSIAFDAHLAFLNPTAPIAYVSFDDALEFAKITQTEIPTENQWVAAYRAGTTTKYFFGDDPNMLKDYAWYWDNARGEVYPVGEVLPNGFGLYDMCGNVDEWCDTKLESSGLRPGHFKTKGGSSRSMASLCTYSSTTNTYYSFRGQHTGFRVAKKLFE